MLSRQVTTLVPLLVMICSAPTGMRSSSVRTRRASAGEPVPPVEVSPRASTPFTAAAANAGIASGRTAAGPLLVLPPPSPALPSHRHEAVAGEQRLHPVERLRGARQRFAQAAQAPVERAEALLADVGRRLVDRVLQLLDRALEVGDE